MHAHLVPLDMVFTLVQVSEGRVGGCSSTLGMVTFKVAPKYLELLGSRNGVLACSKPNPTLQAIIGLALESGQGLGLHPSGHGALTNMLGHVVVCVGEFRVPTVSVFGA